MNSQFLFVISIDGKPSFFCTNRRKIHKQLRRLIQDHSMHSPEWSTLIDRISSREYNLVRFNRNHIIQYEEVYCRLRIDKIGRMIQV